MVVIATISLAIALSAPAIARDSARAAAPADPPATTPAQDALEVSGVVLDPFGEPVPAARIAVAGHEEVSSEEGQFLLMLQPGDWELRVTHPA
jgi:hypothetical protein